MALGDRMCVPFRAMDEFDIFMDSVNRKKSIKLLIKYATERKKSQFIFLTPQDISGFEGPHVRIFKLRPALRGQQTFDGYFRVHVG